MSNINKSLKSKTLSGIIWKFSERISAQMVSFIVSIVLARLLAPEDYGVIAIVSIFITICDEFVSGGFATALIQKKDADNIDFSSVLYFSVFISLILYSTVFFSAPYIANFYENDIICPVLRVMGLRLIIGAINSVQHAYVCRTMQFRRFFWSTLIGTVGSAVAGILMAYKGFGVWALVAQYCFNVIIDTIVLWFTVKWRPEWCYSFSRMKDIISYSWKIFAASFIRTIYNNMRSLVIGKVYSSDDLAFYNRGQSFPQLISTNINGTIDSVLFSAISKEQNNKDIVLRMLRRSLSISSYIIIPLMLGMLVTAKPLIILLLTEKWLESALYLKIACISFAFMPIETANLQSIKAIGRSDIVLKLEIIKKVLGFTLLIIALPFGVIAIALSMALSTIVGVIINMLPNKNLLNYSYSQQIADITPALILSIVMLFVISPLSYLNLSVEIILLLQVFVGVITYIFLSWVFKVKSFQYIVDIIKKLR